MKPRQVIPRQRANQDVEEAVDHYLQEGGEAVALGFIEALERAYSHLSGYPATGLTRFAHELDIPELRAWPLRHFPYLVFYVERTDHIDVWRVLHGSRDLPESLRERD